MEGTTAGKKILGHVEVYDPRAKLDIFTYGPLDIVKKMLMFTDPEGLHQTCETNTRVRDICQTRGFKREYFEFHEQEILAQLEKIVKKRQSTQSDIEFYTTWSRIVGGKWNPAIRNNEYILSASRKGNAEIVRLLLDDDRVNPADRNNQAIAEASEHGHVEVVRLLLKDPRVDPSVENYPLTEASKHGNYEVVELLLKDRRVDPSAYNNEAINEAVDWKQIDVIGLLLSHPKVSPTDPDSENNALQLAIQNGSVGIVKLLLNHPKTDPTANEDAAFKDAVSGRKKKSLALLEQWYKSHGIPLPKLDDSSSESSESYEQSWM
jgi:hypothetical protein